MFASANLWYPQPVTLRRHLRPAAIALAIVCAIAPAARAAERITLKSGFSFDCTHRVTTGQTVRLFFPSPEPDTNYLDIPASNIVSVETIPDLPPVLAPTPTTLTPAAAALTIAESLNPTLPELHELLAHAGQAHHIDADLLAAVVHAESAGHAQAVSRAGARGLMQLMPGTAAVLGVQNSFVPSQNVEGGTKYLDQLLTRYHDNIALALAAYNAGPGAVDRYHGVPPFRETRAYVSRIIREFNHRKSLLVANKLVASK